MSSGIDKPPFVVNPVFGSQMGEMCCQNGSGDISNESGEQGLSISRLHSHEALSRHGIHTGSWVIEEFAFVANESLSVEFERFTHRLRDPVIEDKLAKWKRKWVATSELTPKQPRRLAYFPIHEQLLSSTCCHAVRKHRRRRDFGLCCTL